MSNLLRHLLALLGLSAFACVVLGLNAWSVVEHYVSTSSALTLAGLEPFPLRADPFLRDNLGAMFPEATLPQAVAASVAASEAIGTFILAHTFVEIARMLRHWQEFARTSEVAEVRAAKWAIALGVVFSIPIGALVALALRWELELFHLRTLAELAGIRHPGAALSRLVDWDTYVAQRGHTIAAVVNTIAAQAWVAMIPLGAIALEWALHTVSNRWTLVAAAWDALDGAPVVEAPVAAPVVTAAPHAVEVPAPAAAPATAAPAVPLEVADDASPADSGVFARTGYDEELLEVLGDPGRARITLRAALADPARYHVDLSTRRVWLRAVHGALSGAA